MEYIPGWTDFYLNNAIRLDVLSKLKGLEEYAFHDCYEMAPVADVYDVNFLSYI